MYVRVLFEYQDTGGKCNTVSAARETRLSIRLFVALPHSIGACATGGEH